MDFIICAQVSGALGQVIDFLEVALDPVLQRISPILCKVLIVLQFGLHLVQRLERLLEHIGDTLALRFQESYSIRDSLLGHLGPAIFDALN